MKYIDLSEECQYRDYLKAVSDCHDTQTGFQSYAERHRSAPTAGTLLVMEWHTNNLLSALTTLELRTAAFKKLITQHHE